MYPVTSDILYPSEISDAVVGYVYDAYAEDETVYVSRLSQKPTCTATMSIVLVY